MKYVCLIYLDEANYDSMSDQEKDHWINAMLDHDEELRQTGRYVSSNALQLPQNAVSLRVRNDGVLVTDGPFAETKEHLSGYIVIEAHDLNDAINVAGRIPVASFGTIEVRPVEILERRPEAP